VNPPPADARIRPAALVATLQPWTEIAEAQHRRVLDFADPEDGWEILWVGAGAARAATWWAARQGGNATAVDPDPGAIAWAQRAARGAGVGARVTLQGGRADDLPHTEAVFDLVIVTLLFDPGVDTESAIRQAAHVVRPLRPVVAVVPAWSGSPADGAEAELDRVGVRPRFLTAWKQVARDAGLVEIVGETVLRDGPWLATGVVAAAARAFAMAGLDGVRAALGRPVRTLRRLARRGAVGLAMVRGVRWPAG
jgi:SAM-dependent methyltransferase